MSKTSQARKGGRPSSLLEAKFDGMTLCTQFFDFPSLTSWTKAGISFSFFSSFSVSFFKAALIFFSLPFTSTKLQFLLGQPGVPVLVLLLLPSKCFDMTPMPSQ